MEYRLNFQLSYRLDSSSACSLLSKRFTSFREKRGTHTSICFSFCCLLIQESFIQCLLLEFHQELYIYLPYVHIFVDMHAYVYTYMLNKFSVSSLNTDKDLKSFVQSHLSQERWESKVLFYVKCYENMYIYLY